MNRSKLDEFVELNTWKSTILSEAFPSFRNDIVMDNNFKELSLLIEGVTSFLPSCDEIEVESLQENILCLMEDDSSHKSKEILKKIKKQRNYKSSAEKPQENEIKSAGSVQYESIPNNDLVRDNVIQEYPATVHSIPNSEQPTDALPVLNRKELSPEPVKTEKNTKLSNHEIAKFLEDNHIFAVINKSLHYWNSTIGHFIGLAGEKSDLFVRQNIPNNLKNLITARSIDEIIKWLTSNEQLAISEETLAERKNYISFKNGIVSVNHHSLYKHSPEFCFTSVVNADYPLEEPTDGQKFEEFMNQITGGSQMEYFRLQELFGYVLSEIRDVKVIPFLIGPKDSGKSIVLKLLAHLVGEEYCSSLSLEQMNQADYLCQLFGKKLNACGEISEIPLKRLDTLKKLSGGDPLAARYLYAQPMTFVNQAALLFAGNLLPVLKGIDRSNAFIERLEIFPFKFQVPKEKQDIHLYDKLLAEKSYIAWWAIKGLRRWIKNNYQFTKSKNADETFQKYKITDNSIGNFVDACCTLGRGTKEHNSTLYKAYQNFCTEREIFPENSRSFHHYMQQVKGLKHHKFRKDGTNQNGYEGIHLRNEEVSYDSSESHVIGKGLSGS